MAKWTNWTGNILVAKEIQGGGTTWGLYFCTKEITREKTIFYQTMTLDTVLEDMYVKAKECGIRSEDIIDARTLNVRSNDIEKYKGKVIVSNKHPTYFAQINLLRDFLENKYGNKQQEFIWDEYDMDQPGFNNLNGQDGEPPQKDLFNNIFYKKFYRTWFISGSNIAAGFSDIHFDHILDLHEGQEEDMEQNLLRLEDLKQLTMSFDDFIENHIKKDEGFYISNYIINEEQEMIAKQMRSLMFRRAAKVQIQIRNKNHTKTNLKTCKGILVGHKSLPRAVSITHFYHQALELSKKTHQASIMQRMRILGWNKKLPTGNYVDCSDEDWEHFQWAIKMERQFGEIKFLSLPPKERHKILEEEEWNSKYQLLPDFKDNNFKEEKRTSKLWEKIDTMFVLPKLLSQLSHTIVSVWVEGTTNKGTRVLAMNPFAMTQTIEKHPLDTRTKNMWNRTILIPPTKKDGEWKYTKKEEEKGYIKVLFNSNKERLAISTDYIIQANSVFGHYDIFYNVKKEPKYIKKLVREK